MATNQAIRGRYHINVPVPVGVLAGMSVLVGSLSGVVLATQPIAAPLSPVSATIDLGEDCYFIAVTSVTTAIKPGDQLFAAGGTVDVPTNITYNVVLSNTAGGVPFGNALAGVGTGLTATIAVRLKGGGGTGA